jgi:acyl CoA:acetate/3-ketoacid CoA transferase alpha subunit/acyl CoA:acetate/3-ketoacid CoA transferase beta subunit
VDRELREWIERRFAIPRARTHKVARLDDAVASNVRPADTIHFGFTHARGSAAFWEVLRQFHGSDPGFTLCGVQVTTPISPLVHAGLARKVVTSWAGDSYMTPGPNAVYQRAWKSGDVEFEHWSILTYTQRLAAGARGIQYTSTRSLLGSTMELENGIQRLDASTALIPSLVPDVSIFHAPAADEFGNVLFAPPLMENVWGALAAKRGCIVTVDRVVDSDFVRAHAHMTRLPSNVVLAVVEAPLGAHPGGLLPAGVEGVGAYGEDYEFWTEIRDAARDPASLDAWIKEWILETQTHERYLKKLGADRIDLLRRRAQPEGWRKDLEENVNGLVLDGQPNAIETAIVVAARELADAVKKSGHQTMLAGAGMANLAAWLAAYSLADEGIIVDLIAEMGLVGYWPRPGEPILFNQRNFPTCTMLSDIDTTLAVLIGGGRARSIGALGAAQVDKHGNINSTLVPGEYLLMGSGGANDVITCATESLVIATQSKERFLDQVQYVTGPGARVSTVVSTLGVFHKDQDELILTSVFGNDVDEAARECVARCGWDLRVARGVEQVEQPRPDELKMLRLMDPKGWFRA